MSTLGDSTPFFFPVYIGIYFILNDKIAALCFLFIIIKGGWRYWIGLHNWSR
jgi:hypothetical protein